MSARLSDHDDEPRAKRVETDPLRDLARRIDALRAAGAARCDPPAFALLRSLQERATSDRRANGRALAWALERCRLLETSLVAAERTMAPEALVLDFVSACASLRRSPDAARRWAESRAHLDRSLLEARTAALSARSHAASEAPSGPYNPTALVGKLVARLDELAPDYLHAWVTTLDDLAALHQQQQQQASHDTPKSRRSRPPR